MPTDTDDPDALLTVSLCMSRQQRDALDALKTPGESRSALVRRLAESERLWRSGDVLPLMVPHMLAPAVAWALRAAAETIFSAPDGVLSSEAPSSYSLMALSKLVGMVSRHHAHLRETLGEATEGDPFAGALLSFRAILRDEVARNGREALLARPQGALLDALDRGILTPEEAGGVTLQQRHDIQRELTRLQVALCTHRPRAIKDIPPPVGERILVRNSDGWQVAELRDDDDGARWVFDDYGWIDANSDDAPVEWMPLPPAPGDELFSQPLSESVKEAPVRTWLPTNEEDERLIDAHMRRTESPGERLFTRGELLGEAGSAPLPPSVEHAITVERSTVEPTALSGRPRYRVCCWTCRTVLHGGTTDPGLRVSEHVEGADLYGEPMADDAIPPEALALDTPWPLADVLDRLADVADHLREDHDCDRHGYEEDLAAAQAARAIVGRIREAGADLLRKAEALSLEADALQPLHDGRPPEARSCPLRDALLQVEGVEECLVLQNATDRREVLRCTPMPARSVRVYVRGGWQVLPWYVNTVPDLAHTLVRYRPSHGAYYGLWAVGLSMAGVGHTEVAWSPMPEGWTGGFEEVSP